MSSIRQANLRHLDHRLAELDRCFTPVPPEGWLRSVRVAIGLSGYELGARLGVGQARISQLERAELRGSLRLGTLERVAAAMRCQLRYVLIPIEPLEYQAQEHAMLKEAGWRAKATTMPPEVPKT
jgi:predicted DNA-binding mobile mystery protein A